MPRVLHIVVSDGFAGVERYVCNTASETASRGWKVAVVGGNPEQMRAELDGGVRWEPGATLLESMRSVLRLGRWDICHVQMTAAEAVGVTTQRVHRATIVSTRNFPARRGASRIGHIVAPWIARRIAREIATSEFIAWHLELPPAAVVVSGVPKSACLWRPENHTVLVLQRLEAEKDTLTALGAWHASRLADDGWTLRVVGDGSQRPMLERRVASEGISGVTFTGWTGDVAKELEHAGVLLASAPAEPLGLSVIEAMAAGVPVVACGFGGHLETVGRVAGAPLFPPRDAAGGGTALRSLLSDSTRARLSAEGRRVFTDHFTVEQHVDQLLVQYEAARAGVARQRGAGVSEGLL
jgi:glycosyltransferase involved in cell wall biosynthesis